MAVPVQKNQNLNSQRSIESEKALIASVLSDNDKIDDVLPIIKKDMFYNSFHALVWEKIVMLYKNGVQVDITTIKSQLQNNDSPEGTPASDIIEFFNHMTTPSHAVQYAKNVYEKSELRRLSVLVNKIQASIGGDNAETADSLSKIHGLIGNVLSIHGDDKFDLQDTIKNAISDMQNQDNTIRFGYGNLDKMVGGMRRGEITVIAGRPGHFKSTMAVNLVDLLLKRGYKVLVFNREMKNTSMMQKLLVAESTQVSYSRVVTGVLSEKDKIDIDVTSTSLADQYGSNLIMKDMSNDFESTVALIRQIKPDVVVDDYIGLATLRHIEDPRLRTDAIMKEYKMLCKSYNMCAILVSQLNRKCEERPNKRPIPSDLRESGSIEHDAETILFMYYEWRYLGVGSKNGEFGIDIVVGKNRYGKTGIVELGVLGDKCKIYDHHSVALADSYEIQELSKDEDTIQGNKDNSGLAESVPPDSEQQRIPIS
jgi:replicative DNA helicase|tara:strand:+ start:1078 stop:2520 length:1443 start_codon:yes stop_codon:yes gene_type:complete